MLTYLPAKADRLGCRIGPMTGNQDVVVPTFVNPSHENL